VDDEDEAFGLGVGDAELVGAADVVAVAVTDA
jgi:hypothetical protein